MNNNPEQGKKKGIWNKVSIHDHWQVRSALAPVVSREGTGNLATDLRSWLPSRPCLPWHQGEDGMRASKNATKCSYDFGHGFFLIGCLLRCYKPFTSIFQFLLKNEILELPSLTFCWRYSPWVLFLHVFPFLKICSLILEREGGVGGERERGRETLMWREASTGCLSYMPWLGIKPAT